jgi:membrane protease YdiL (CAAX protease family)
VATEESQQQLDPLLQEHADPPAPAPSIELQSAATPAWIEAWLDVVKAVAIWVASVLMLLLIPTVVALPYLIYRIAKFGPPTPEALASDPMLIFYSMLGILPAHLLTLAVMWMIVTEAGRRPFWKTVGFEWPENMGPVVSLMLSLLVGIILCVLAFGITYLYGERKTDLDIIIESSLYTRITTAFVAVATAPLIEELIYRGVLYRALEKAAGIAIAIAVPSLLFAGVHVFQYRKNIAVVGVITLLSITLTAVRAASGKLLPCFIIHLVFNGIQSVLIVLGGFIDKDILK